MYRFTYLLEYPFCLHGVTKKESSLGLQFSLALHTHESPWQIIANRERLQEQFSDMEFIVANQTHSANIQIIQENQSRGWRELDSAIKDCDALITNQRGVMLSILTADCVPVLLLDPINRVVGAVHAGWRGTNQKILYQTIQKMQERFGSDPKEIIAGIAPSIGRCCYEVGEDVAKHFFKDMNAMDRVGEKYMLDLPYLNQQQLLNAGLQTKNIELSNICTACEVDHYFSYRQEQGCSGRFMSMIGLTEM